MPEIEKVTLQNVSKRMHVYVLAGKHLEAAKHDHPNRFQDVKLVTVHHSRSDGKFHAQTRHVPMASSLRIAAGAKVTVHKDVVHAPAIKKALAMKELRILKDEPEPEPKEAQAQDEIEVDADEEPEQAQ